MTDLLDDSSRTAMITYRLERSEETLREADYLIKGGYYSTAINRLYYACYYAVSALLIKNKIQAQTHAGVKSMLSLHFIRTGRIDVQTGKDFFRLFDLRHNNDYDDFSFCDKETILDMRPKAEAIIRAINTLLKQG